MNKLIILTLTIVVCSGLSPLFAQTGITFTFANGQVTGSSPQYYEFDVMAYAGAADFRIGDNQVYINYNSAAFGVSIETNGKITVDKGTLLQGETPPFGEHYTIINVEDNGLSRVAITNEYNFDPAAIGNELLTTPLQLIHVRIEIADPSESSGLSFEQALMVGQQYEDVYDQDTNPTAVFGPVTANDIDDTSLPVELTIFTAEAINSKVVVNWATESEINNLGFEVYRSITEDADYIVISDYNTNPDLAGHGNSSTRHEYSFTDESVKPETTYWYKLADLDYKGMKTFHGPVSVTAPKALPTGFKLHSNYPNPFNPTTTVGFDIPPTRSELVDVKIVIYNTLGQVTKNLYQDKLGAGSYEVQWDGTTDSGNNAPSGIYFLVFRTHEFSQTKKLVLVK
jgi:hypothetical protein